MEPELLPPSKKLEHYEWNVKNHLGNGSYGKVYLGRDTKTKTLIAIKVIEMSTLEDKYLMESLNNEVTLMKKIKSPNVVELLDVLFTKNNVYIIQEYCNGGDLRSYLSKKKGVISELEAVNIFTDILKGFVELHKLGVIHRDLKPENILILDSTFKIGDFGFAKHVDNYQSQLLTSLVGTPLYMSPQILMSDPYTTKSDIWSLGLIYFEMLFGKTPWPAKSQYQLITNINKIPLKFPYNIKISTKSEQFLKGCLHVTEKNRFSWENVFDHELFNKNGEKSPKKKISHDISMKLQKELDGKARIIIQKLQNIMIKNKVDITKLFQTLDQTKSQSIYLAEFKNLVKCLDKKVSENEIEHIFKKFDDDGNGEISLEEFRKILIETDFSNYKLYKDPFLEERAGKVLVNLNNLLNKGGIKLEKLFEMFDRDNSNTIDYNEFQKMLNYVDKDLTNKEIEYVFKKFDEDNSNSLELNEFKKALEPKNLVHNKAIIENLDQRCQKIIEELKELISQNNYNLKKVFKKLDKSGKNGLNLKDFNEFIKIIDETAKDEEIEYLFSKMDVNGDHSISFSEFKQNILS